METSVNQIFLQKEITCNFFIAKSLRTMPELLAFLQNPIEIRALGSGLRGNRNTKALNF